jgi:SAM-dependent methyltransferase
MRRKISGCGRNQQERVFSDPLLRLFSQEAIQKATSALPIFTQPPIRVLEIGGFGGITKLVRPDWLVSDIRFKNDLDLVFDSTKIPFKSSTVDLVYAIDVLHHIRDLESFVNELNRILKPNGIIYFREPYWGLIAQIVWRFLHPEKYNIRALKKLQSFENPMDGNQAIAQGILKKKSKEVQNLFDGFDLTILGPHLGLAFALSGGHTFTTRFPRNLLLHLHEWEKKHPQWLKYFAFAIDFTLLKPTPKI